MDNKIKMNWIKLERLSHAPTKYLTKFPIQSIVFVDRFENLNLNRKTIKEIFF